MPSEDLVIGGPPIRDNHLITSLGVDGCRGGWLCAAVTAGPGSRQTTNMEFELYAQFEDCLGAAGDRAMVIDIPIGLLDVATEGGRLCDRLARELLGWPRRNSVFSPPARTALYARDYREAIRLNGRGMSQQAFGIIPKIREVDEAISPGDQEQIYEGHPELSFMRLAGAALEEPKRKSAGRRRRRELVESYLGIQIDTVDIRARFGRQRVAHDDVLDAAVLAISGQYLGKDNARQIGGGERDSRGFEMAMWY